MLKKYLFIILSIFTFTLLSPSPIRAQNTDDILTEFCERRQGDVINLETWYAGECDPDSDTSTFSGSKLGFGDIIILHVYELLSGENSTESDQDIMDKLFELFKNSLSDSGQFNYLTFVNSFDQNSAKISNNSGILAGVGYLVGTTLSHPPVSTRDYVASVRSNMAKHSLVQPAYAQNESGQGGGYGFANFQGFLPMWRAFRNISYFFFVLAFVAYGFAIMFRVKLGQAAVTIQQAIPKLIVTLLIITFSYAIVGLLIDFMWVLYYVVLNTLGTFNVFGNGVNPSSNIIARIFEGEYGLVLSALAQGIVGFFFGLPAAISALVGLPFITTYLIIGGIGIASGGTAIVIIGVVFLLAILIAFAKLLIKLISAYVSIIGNLVLAPLILLPDAIPGQGGAFGKWLNNLVANIVVFPIASILLLFSGFFMIQPVLDLFNSSLTSIASDVIVPNLNPAVSSAPPRVPLLNPNIPILSGESDASNWMALIGLALLLMSPKFVDLVQKAFKVTPLQTGIGETIGGGIAGASLSQYVADNRATTYRSSTIDRAKVANQLSGIFGGGLKLPEKP